MFRKQTLFDLPACWPPLPLEAWKDTCATLHMWMQIVGKVRLALTPKVNHWWNVPLYVSSRGLTTSLIPYGERVFEMEFDFIDHQLCLRLSNGITKELLLAPRSVADFYREFMDMLRAAGIQVEIWKMPVEIPDPIAFDQDHIHASYDREFAQRFWRVLVSADEVLKEFRSRFIGKVSPVHFFWGSFDLAVTRFSGRTAPPPKGHTPYVADWVMAEAYSHECSSCGFWPGNGGFGYPAYYVYAYPEPDGYGATRLSTADAAYNKDVGQFILPYDAVREARDPDNLLLGFLQETYAAAADLAKWDRAALERGP